MIGNLKSDLILCMYFCSFLFLDQNCLIKSVTRCSCFTHMNYRACARMAPLENNFKIIFAPAIANILYSAILYSVIS